MNNITLGVQLIVKDEAELLPECLASVAGVDEIVVIDHASTDDSIAIAQAYGAKVYQRVWTNSFSEARNEGLSHAETDWILVLDADERLLTPLQDIRNLLQNTTAHALTVNIDNYLGVKPEDRIKHPAVRLFRNGQGFKYSGRIHEGIDNSILSQYNSSVIEHSEVEIIHVGYLTEIMTRKNKIKRNEHLLRLTIAEEPGEPFHTYNLAVTCCQDGRLTEAETLLRQSLQHVSMKASYRPTMIRDLCKIYLTHGKMKSIAALLELELERYGDYPDLHYLYGQSLESQGLLERALQSYQYAASITEDKIVNSKYVCEQGMNSFRPLCRMGVLSQQFGLQEDAARFFHRALGHHSLYKPALEGIASAFQRLEVPDQEIATLLIQLVPTHSAAGRSNIIDSLYKINAYETIATFSREMFPLELDTADRMISALMITGRLDHALAAIKETSLLSERYILWAICHWEQSGDFKIENLNSIPNDIRAGLDFIQKQLRQQAVSTTNTNTEIGKDHIYSGLISSLIQQSIIQQQPSLGYALANLFPAYRAELASALYKEGKYNAAGEQFITLVSDNLADAQTHFYIAEMVFDKGHYTEASDWFKRVLEQAPTYEAASIGLSLCYLQQAKLSMEDALNSIDEAYAHGPLQEDIHSIKKSITFLHRTAWHTEWSYRQSEGR